MTLNVSVRAERVFSGQFFLLWLVTSFVAAVTGPLGTFLEMRLATRASYWAVVIGLSMVTMSVIRRRLAAITDGYSQGVVVVIEILVFSAVFSPMLCLITWAATGATYFSPREDFPVLCFAVVVVTIGVSLYTHLMRGDQNHAVVDRPQLFQRLELPDSAVIYRLSSNDHYVEVYVGTGEVARVLMRLADAVREMNGLNGFCVHRSHWVSQAAIETAFRCKGRDYVRLRDGSEIPVGKKYRDNLVTAGFLTA